MPGIDRARRWIARLGDLLTRRRWPLGTAAALLLAGIAYSLLWAPAVRHGSYWLMSEDLWGSFLAAVEASHGHFGQVYSPSTGFLSFPGLILLLVPIAALSNALHLGTEIPGNLVAHPSAWLVLDPLSLVLSTVALFACDAVAERLGAKSSRRVALMVIEGIVVWNVAVFWGHPEDALALGLALYALLSSLDDRWGRAGWLFGAALVTQPLVIMILPILLAVAGKDRALGFMVRGAIPAAVLTLFPLLSNFHQTVHVLADQPTFPNLDHRTPWTTFAPTISGRGLSLAVSAGPTRIVGLLLASVLGWRARRWKDQPNLLVWSCALALALRCATESVMTDYYVWPALAVGLVAAAAVDGNRLAAASGAAFFTTVTAQWRLGEFPWWLLEMVGMTAVLLCGVETTTQRLRRLQVQEYELRRARAARGRSKRKGRSSASKRGAKAVRRSRSR